MSAVDDAVAGHAAALRAVTEATSDGRSTRARVLLACQRQRGGVLAGRARVLVVALLTALSSAAVAWSLVERNRAPAAGPAALARPPAHPASHSIAEVRMVPTPPPADLPALDPTGPELALYERAHEAQFRGTSAARALPLWDEYLARFPSGLLGPEAAFNRALCLLRLGRLRAAARALRPFAEARFGPYRIHDACALLRGLAARDAALDLPKRCEL